MARLLSEEGKKRDRTASEDAEDEKWRKKQTAVQAKQFDKEGVFWRVLSLNAPRVSMDPVPWLGC